MPSRNRIKIYVKDGYYHIYNRGVAKQTIYLDKQDYAVFLKFLQEAFDKPQTKKVERYVQGRSFNVIERQVKNFQKEIFLLVYCLMPNHFHFLIKQNNKNSMESFMRSITTRYVSYFNKKYDRVGPLFQGRYKAILVTKDDYLLHLSRYIHLNPSEYTKDITKAFSSYGDYIGLGKTKWVRHDFILNFFNNPTVQEISKVNDYKSFVEKYKKDSRKILGDLTLE